MDIVKRAQGNIASCTVDDKHVVVAGKSYARDIPVDFSTKKTKPYSLDSVVFYLMNRELPLVAYVEQCKKRGIPQVAYLDRASIEGDIASYAELGVPGFFVKPVYTHRKTYNIPYCDGSCYIIVPNDVSSPVNVNTFASLLPSSTARHADLGDAPSVDILGRLFILCDEPAQLRDSDWRGVRAIFLDNAREQIRGWESRFYEAARKAAVFSLCDEPFRCTKISIKDDKIVNHEDVCEKIVGADARRS